MRPVPARNVVESSGFRGTCDVPCGADADCGSLGAEHSCRSGVCRAPASSVLEPPTGSAQQPLVHSVDAETCKSGLRWVGGDSPSAEMRPGSDCLGCHGEGSDRPFLAAGTVYPFAIEPAFDLTPEDSSDREPSADCLGLEGVEVLIRDAIGRRLSTTTNRAGNFYFDASESAFTLPYDARLRAGEITPAMAISPMYGGCGRCHGTTLPASGPFDLTPEDPEYVSPVSAIYTPGLYRNDSE